MPSQPVDFLLFIFETDIPTSNTDIAEIEKCGILRGSITAEV